ncbi:RagB/SusD family nutrient uptake outer membrane protein [Pedobacter sp. UBA4863]|uniref:RagB/SusD family nutrient uptake outer membrane protein n=1 Tax=Pedobacter sp. UBA4863 TaxID=1947060 RepID=UPI0025F9EE71|nr:RagB/SusD family nutrient uptake outer membrane protein [Pedobacter sp. UBA4863]
MKSSIKHINILLVTLALSLGACKDSFLDLKNPQSLPLNGTIKDLATLTTAGNGAYAQLKDVNYYGRSFLVIPELFGDNAFVSRSNGGRYQEENLLAITRESGVGVSAWAAMYRTIVNANITITEGEKLPVLAAHNQVIGEMYALRALAYFDLVRLFAQPYNFTANASHLGVPLVLERKDELIKPARSTVAEVYDQIVSDLKKSLTLMTTAQKPAKFTPTAANGLLAKVYLYMEDWENAEKYATDAIAGPYTLLARTAYVTSWANKFSVESLFEVGTLTTDNLAANSIGYFYEQAGYGEGLATQDLYSKYTASDVRRSLIQVGVRSVTFENPAYFVKKYPKGTSTRDDNLKVLRLSEVYLIRAEARAELGRADATKNAGALSDLNMIAQRADAAALALAGLTGDDLVERILLERRKELAFEGNRFFDLTRRKKNVDHWVSETNLSPTAPTLPTPPVTFTYPNEKFVYPIPFAEITANPNIKQNPGWVQ